MTPTSGESIRDSGQRDQRVAGDLDLAVFVRGREVDADQPLAVALELLGDRGRCR